MYKLEKLKPLALLLLRVGLGVIFIYHGFPKLAHSEMWKANFVHMGFPPYFAYIAGVLEVLGGLGLILGLFTRVCGLLLAVELGIAAVKVHMPQGSILSVGNYELPLLLSVGSFTLTALGAGAVSLDHFVFGKKA
ncbi:MAG TPA: DoxX family protein [Blastocatellia bacterium]|nr:DoxX family protein [Blastocatellia bacterium]